VFVPYLAARLPDRAAAADDLAGVHVADLFVACGCVLGDPPAMAAFQADHGQAIRAAEEEVFAARDTEGAFGAEGDRQRSMRDDTDFSMECEHGDGLTWPDATLSRQSRNFFELVQVVTSDTASEIVVARRGSRA
jgi:hypothetical protein